MISSDINNTYIGHLEDFRKKIIYILSFFVIVFIVSFIFYEYLYSFLSVPIKDLNVTLYYFKPYEKIIAYLKLCFLFSVAVSIPFALFQLLLFLLPAMFKHEIIIAISSFFIMLMLYVTGLFIGYYFILPFACRFFVDFLSNDGVSPMWSILEYTGFFFSAVFSSAFIFQTPVLLFSLIFLRIVPLALLKKFRPFVVIIIFIFSAIITPPDIYTQIIFGIILYLLFECTILISSLILRDR